MKISAIIEFNNMELKAIGDNILAKYMKALSTLLVK